MKKAIKLVLKLLVIAVSIGGFSYLGYHIYNRYFIGSNADKPKVLAVVKNVSFDSKTNMLTWSNVNHADYYKASINNVEYEVGTNKLYYVPVSYETTFKIKGFDSTGNYATPGWSKEYKYTLQNDEINYSTVHAYINDVLPASDIMKVVSAYVVNDNSFFDGLHTNCWVNDAGYDKMMELVIYYNDDVSSISDCLNNHVTGISILNSYDIATYDSASYLLQSNKFDGRMEKRRLEGYEFSVVSSQTTHEDIDGFHIFATYKLTKGDDVKYIQSNVDCYIRNASTNEKLNYTTRLLDTENVVLRERSYIEFKGDEIIFAKSMDEVQIQKY